MKIILDLVVVNESNRSVHEMLRKQYDRDYLPTPDMLIEESVWGDNPKKPKRIILHIEEDYCVLQFEDEKKSSGEECAGLVSAYKGHGWKNPKDWPL